MSISLNVLQGVETAWLRRIKVTIRRWTPAILCAQYATKLSLGRRYLLLNALRLPDPPDEAGEVYRSNSEKGTLLGS